jgi:hypothetical protein
MKSHRKTSRKTSRKASRGKKDKLVYIGKFNQRSHVGGRSKPSSRRWFKHDIVLRGNNHFVGESFAPNVIRNDRDDDGNYLDPVTYDPIRDGDDIVCLGNPNSYYCFSLETIKRMIESGNPINPMTRATIDVGVVRSILAHDHPALENSSDTDMQRLITFIGIGRQRGVPLNHATQLWRGASLFGGGHSAHGASW